MIIWITGMSGVGKTTLAEAVAALVRRRGEHILLVDGDVLREVFGGDLGHSEADRRINMARMARLCYWLDAQKTHAVAAVIAPYQETRDWMRKHSSAYCEVYISSPLELLTERDPKGLYRRALAGETDLPGVNQVYDNPARPDRVIRNAGSLPELLAHAGPLADLVSPQR